MIKVEYGVTTAGAKEGFVPELLNCAPISNADDLQQDDLIFKNFANPCEKYGVLLDGGSMPIPENTEDENIGVWSLYTADENGQFEVLPTITLISDELFIVDGLGLVFDVKNNIYPTKFDISFYNGDTPITSKEYQSNSPTFSLMENVDNFNKIVIVFSEMNTPYSRLKLHSIEYGSILIIDGAEIKNLKIYQSVSPISNIIPIGSLDLTFLNSSNANYNFAARQSLKVSDNENVIGKYFIDKAQQKNRQEWVIKAYDYINILESTDFEGGIYTDELALNVITAIFNKAGVPFTITDELSSKTVTGYIPYTNCRKALQQVLFAIGGYSNTAYSESVDILSASEDIVEEIPLERILMGQTISVDADITQVELTAHTYAPIDDEAKLHEAKENESELRVIFSEPIHDLSIENGDILESGTNYAIISCVEGGVLKGKKYQHTTFTKSKYNGATNNTTSTNKKSIKNATLISPSNIDNILNICYNYVVRNKTVKSRIVEGDEPIIVGGTYQVETELLGDYVGIATEQNFSLYGGRKIVKQTVIK